MKIVCVFLTVVLACGTVFASTDEALSFWTQFDITFWQTMPFAVFWGYLIGSQLSRGGEVNMSPAINIALLVSAANAYVHARRVSAK